VCAGCALVGGDGHQSAADVRLIQLMCLARGGSGEGWYLLLLDLLLADLWHQNVNDKVHT